MEFAGVIIQAVIGGVITGAAAWGAIRVELKYIKRDVDDLRRWRDVHNENLLRRNGDAA